MDPAVNSLIIPAVHPDDASKVEWCTKSAGELRAEGIAPVLTAEVGPGDALYLPCLWLHEVHQTADSEGGEHSSAVERCGSQVAISPAMLRTSDPDRGFRRALHCREPLVRRCCHADVVLVRYIRTPPPAAVAVNSLRKSLLFILK